MIFFLLSLLFREDFDDSFIRKVNDNDFRSVIRRDKSGFLFFHHVGMLVSDTAYLRYVDIAKKYKNSSHFYACIPFNSPHLCHDMKVTGFPTLYYLRNSTSHDELYGAFTFHNIDVFISEHTNNSIPELKLEEETKNLITKAKTVTEATTHLLSYARTDDFDTSEYLFVFAKDTSKFGRAATTLSQKVKNSQLKFVRVSEELSLSQLSIPIPSLLFIRKGDNQPFIYKKEPLIEPMLKWFNSIPKSRVLSFVPSLLFSEDTSSTKTILHFQKREKVISEIDFLVNLSHSFPTMQISYADPDEYKKFSNLFDANIDDNICVESNYTTFIYAKCSNVDDIQKFNKKQLDPSKVKTIEVPPEAYNYIAQTYELGFRALLKRGPTFVAFTAPKEICPECPDFESNVQIASRKIAAILQMNSTHDEKSSVSWVQWNIPTPAELPTFKDLIGSKIPSLYYFPSSQNISAAVPYNGRIDYIAIVEWVNEQKNYFNIIDFLERESKEFNDPYDAL